MSLFKSTKHSRVYRNFRSLEPSAYRDIVHYYERWENQVRALDFEEYFELQVAYVNALFEIGAYQKHLLLVDEIIETSIVQNISNYQGKDLFRDMLFKKAASLYNTMSYEKANYILRELLRIDVENQDAALFLNKCLRKQNPAILRHAKAGSVFLFMLTALIISLEVLLVRPFYIMHADLVENSRNSLFIMGILLLIGGELYNRWLAEREVETYLNQLRSKL